MQSSLDFGDKATPSSRRLERVVVHLDMDCFYCQVEQVRLAIPSSIPLVIQQWENVIAVNYAARAKGITRHASYKACLEQCPELRIVHVPTLNVHNPTQGIRVYGASKGEELRREDCKASLQPYREASMKVFEVIKKSLNTFGAPFILERASVDEVYLDVTEIVNTLMERELGFVIQRGRLVKEGDIPEIDWNTAGKPAIPDLEPTTMDDPIVDLRIRLGCRVAQQLREAVFTDLQYTVSGGIAINKTLAKLASARHKPNQQTFVRPGHVQPWMSQVPFNKIRFLGGKLGNLLLKTFDGRRAEREAEESGVESEEDEQAGTTVMASDMWNLTMEELQRKVGDAKSARWVYNVIRGIDPTPVSPRLLPKSFMAAKQFRSPVKKVQILNDWLLLLVTELVGRLQEDLQIYSRWPNTLTIRHQKPSKKSQSKALEFPFSPDQLPEKSTQLASICLEGLLAEGKVNVFPCAFLALSVSRFKNITEDGKKKSLSMDSFIEKGRPVVWPEVSRKKKDLTSFFTSQAKPSENVNSYKCPKCSRTFDAIDVNGIQEHEDYHFALQIQKSIDSIQ